MKVATHNQDAREYAARQLAVVGDPLEQTRHFCRWIEARVEWESAGIIETMTATGEPVRGLCPLDTSDLDTWAN
jgi:hypothetical protein